MTTQFRFDDPDYYDAIGGPGRPSTQFLRTFGNDGASRVMGPDPDDPKAPVVMILWMQPGGRIPKHAHKNYRFEMIVRGTRILEDGTVFGPGDIEVTEPGEFYGPSIAGPEGTLSMELIASADGAGYILPADICPEDLEIVNKAAEVLGKLRGKEMPVEQSDRT